MGLILQNPCPATDLISDTNVPDASIIPKESLKTFKFKCLCINSKKSSNLIFCPDCETTQHKDCVLRYCTEKKKTYKCPECWKNTKKVHKELHQTKFRKINYKINIFQGSISSSATFICTPASIKQQWKEEIMKHIDDPNFKVLVYEGISQSQTGWISPEDLADYDVVITDFNVLKQEIYFSQNQCKGLRHEKKFISPISPLLMITWWRVCLDEAQMVETTTNQSSKMVKTIPAVHRWSVSGTPIQKHINDIYGLLFFMGFSPYDDFAVWKRLSAGFYEGEKTFFLLSFKLL